MQTVELILRGWKESLRPVYGSCYASSLGGQIVGRDPTTGVPDSQLVFQVTYDVVTAKTVQLN